MNGVSNSTRHRVTSPLSCASVPASTRRIFRVDARVFAPVVFASLLALFAFAIVTFTGGTAQAATANGWEACPQGTNRTSCVQQYQSPHFGLVTFTYSYDDTWDLTTQSGSVLIALTVDKGTAGVSYQCKGTSVYTPVTTNGGGTVDVALLHTRCTSNEIAAIHIVTDPSDGSLPLDGFLLNTTPEPSPSNGSPSPSASPSPVADPVPDDKDCAFTFNVFKILKCAFIPSAQDAAKYSSRIDDIKSKPPLSVALDGMNFLKSAVDIAAGCGGDCPADNTAYSNDPDTFRAAGGVDAPNVNVGYHGQNAHESFAFNPIAQAGDWVQGDGPNGTRYEGPVHDFGRFFYMLMEILVYAGAAWYWYERLTSSLGSKG